MRFCPCILFLVLLEVVLQGKCVLSSGFPYLAVALFEEQKAVVILLHEILQVVILGTELLGLLVEYLLDSLLVLSCDGIDDLLSDIILYALSLEIVLYLVVQLFVSFEVLLADKFHNIVAERHQEGFAHLALVEGVGHVLEFLYDLIGANPGQHAAAHCGAWVL